MARPAISQPHATIGASELLESAHTHSGWLRRRGKLERLLEGLFKGRFKKWRQRFVILAEGNVYYYKDESSRAPLNAFPLSSYNTVKRATDEPNMPNISWCIKLEPLDSGKVHFFASTSQRHMDEWMGKFKYEMTKAHNLPPKSLDEYSGGNYVFLEEPMVKKAPDEGEKKARPPVPEPADSSDEDEDDYNEIDPMAMDEGKKTTVRHMPLPPTPGSSPMPEKITNESKYENLSADGAPLARPPAHQSLPLPKPKYKPAKPKHPSLSREEYSFDSADKEAAAEILEKTRKTGVFLVRRSRKSEREVLAVKTPAGVKEYQIFEVENKKTLDKKEKFQSVENLLQYYSSHQLPTQNVTLKHGYSATNLAAF